MASNAHDVHFARLLVDAEDLELAQARLRATDPGGLHGLAALSRAIVVLAISAWESFVEELMREAVQALRPPLGHAPGAWPALQAHATGLISGFHTPSQANVERLVRSCVGLSDVHLSWRWQNTTPVQATQRLADALGYRHEVAHGVHPRPAVPADYARRICAFLSRLATCTDAAVRAHLVGALGVANPWPA